jgi:pimeloyl-ACP methyl ester carboxylesterase
MLEVTTTPSKRPGAEALVLLPGIGASRRNFARIAHDLAERFELLAVDLPGHNGSPSLEVRPTVPAVADAVEEVLDAHGLDRAHVLGDSLGGRVALELAQRRRTLSVVAIAPSGLGLLPERLHQAAGLALARGVARSLNPVLPALARHRVARTALLPGLQARPWRATEDDVLSLREGFGETRDYWRGLFWACLADVPAGFEQVDSPVVLAQGAGDGIALGQTPRFLPFVPGSRFRLLPWAGHAPMSDVPEEVVRLVHEAADLAVRPAQAESTASAVPAVATAVAA